MNGWIKLHAAREEDVMQGETRFVTHAFPAAAIVALSEWRVPMHIFSKEMVSVWTRITLIGDIRYMCRQSVSDIQGVIATA